MDKLDAQQVSAVMKCSNTAALIVKLTKAGMSEDKSESLNWEHFMAKWVEMLVAGVKT